MADIQLRWDEERNNYQLRRHLLAPPYLSDAQQKGKDNQCRDKKFLTTGTLPGHLVFQMNGKRFGHDAAECSYRCGTSVYGFFEERWLDMASNGGVTHLKVYLEDENWQKNLGESYLQLKYEVITTGNKNFSQKVEITVQNEIKVHQI
jgi:primosomal replication protein N